MATGERGAGKRGGSLRLGGGRRNLHPGFRPQPARNSLTYADAGVGIDAGNAMVERIKPLVRATRRPGADAEIGGLGGGFVPPTAGVLAPPVVAPQHRVRGPETRRLRKECPYTTAVEHPSE